MSRFFWFLLLIIVPLGICGTSAVRAALDGETVRASGSNVELLVVEAEGCRYCPILRRDAEPLLASRSMQGVTMRFADVNEVEASALVLAEPIAIVPTVLVLKEGKETGRISGYLGLEDFMRSVNHLLAQVQ